MAPEKPRSAVDVAPATRRENVEAPPDRTSIPGLRIGSIPRAAMLPHGSAAFNLSGIRRCESEDPPAFGENPVRPPPGPRSNGERYREGGLPRRKAPGTRTGDGFCRPREVAPRSRDVSRHQAGDSHERFQASQRAAPDSVRREPSSDEYRPGLDGPGAGAVPRHRRHAAGRNGSRSAPRLDDIAGLR